MNETVTKKTRVDLSGFQPHHRYQILRCNEAPKPILNAASSHDPAALGPLFGATNVDALLKDAGAPDDPENTQNFVQADIRDMPFGPGDYGAVVYGEILEHCAFDTAKEILREGKRVVGEDGWIIITVPADYGHRLPSIPQRGVPYSYAPGITSWHSMVWSSALLHELFCATDLKPVHAETLLYTWQPPARGFGLVLADVDCPVASVALDPRVGTEQRELINWYVKALQPMRCIVTGCGSLSRRNIRCWLRMFPELEMYAFDLFEGLTAKRAEEEQCVLPNYVCSLHQAQAEYPRIKFVSGDTRKTLEPEVQRIIDEEGMVDLAFLGGGHSYETVLNEILQVAEVVRQDGLIILEDAGLVSVDNAAAATKGMIDWVQEEYHIWKGVMR